MASHPVQSPVVITPEALLDHWQGHRRLTRRVLEMFPEDQLFTFAVSGMRSFGELVQELLAMAAPTARGVLTDEWGEYTAPEARTREELLRLWDEATAEIDALFPQIPAERFQEVMKAFGVYEGPAWWILFYVIDNEVHHRGQGYTYLRALGIEPPAFWER